MNFTVPLQAVQLWGEALGSLGHNSIPRADDSGGGFVVKALCGLILAKHFETFKVVNIWFSGCKAALTEFQFWWILWKARASAGNDMSLKVAPCPVSLWRKIKTPIYKKIHIFWTFLDSIWQKYFDKLLTCRKNERCFLCFSTNPFKQKKTLNWPLAPNLFISDRLGGSGAHR